MSTEHNWEGKTEARTWFGRVREVHVCTNCGCQRDNWVTTSYQQPIPGGKERGEPFTEWSEVVPKCRPQPQAPEPEART